MEAGTAPRQTTGSKTIADLLPKAAELYGDRVAQKHKVGDEWREVSFRRMWELGRGRDAELVRRYEAVKPEDPYTFIYTSGTTGPPKGCVLTHGNYRAIVDSVGERELFRGDDDLVYLYLPLAHAFALLVQLGA